MQLHLKTGFRRVWREAGTLQIGLSRRRGTVLHGLTAADVALLEELREGVEADGPAPDRERDLLHLLAGAGVLADGPPGGRLRDALGDAAERLAPDAAIWSIVRPGADDGWGLLAARAGRRVVVRGGGRLGSTLATTLAAAGVGDVRVDDRRRITAADLAAAGAGLPDLGRRREEAVMDAVRRAAGRPPVLDGTGAPRAHLRAVEVDRPDLVVLVEPGAADAQLAGHLLSADIAHLSVVVQEDVVLVGPLVRPGVGPCLRCLDLHRGDRDPGWPAVLDQVLGSGAGQPEETAVVTLAAGLAGLQVLAFLDGLVASDLAPAPVPASAGATLEVELPDGLIARRSWPAHARCGCHWPPPEPVEEAPRPGTGEDGPWPLGE